MFHRKECVLLSNYYFIDSALRHNGLVVSPCASHHQCFHLHPICEVWMFSPCLLGFLWVVHFPSQSKDVLQADWHVVLQYTGQGLFFILGAVVVQVVKPLGCWTEGWGSRPSAAKLPLLGNCGDNNGFFFFLQSPGIVSRFFMTQ